MEPAKGPGEISRLVMRIESARIRQHPNPGSSKSLRLSAHGGMWPGKGSPIGAHAENRHPARAKALYGALETMPAPDQLGSGDLARLSRRPAHEIRQTVSEIEQQPVFRWIEPAICKPGSEQCGPEAVAGSCEVMADGGGVEPRVDAAEENREPRSDDIWQPSSVAGGDLSPLPRWHGLGRSPRHGDGAGPTPTCR